MATYLDVIEDLKKLGREDAIMELGEMYERAYGNVKNYVDDNYVTENTANWVAEAVIRSEGAINWHNVYSALSTLNAQVQGFEGLQILEDDVVEEEEEMLWHLPV